MGCYFLRLARCGTMRVMATFDSSLYPHGGAADRDAILAEVFADHRDTTSHTAQSGAATPKPSVGELDLEDRSRHRGMMKETEISRTEREDGYDVEYRKLRLERVVLVGVWTEGTVA